MKVQEIVGEQRTPPWFAARKSCVTASSVGAILDLNPWRTRADVMRAMVREHHGAPSEFTGNVATEYGTRHEQDAIKEFEMFNNLGIKECGFFKRDDYPWLGGSPDGIASDEALVEVKCPYGKRDITSLNEFKTLKEQMYYYAQIQICLFVTNRDHCYFIQWAPQIGIKYEIVERNDAWLIAALQKLKAFHDEFLEECRNPSAYINDDSNGLIDEYFILKQQAEDIKARQADIIKELREQTCDKPSVFGEHKLIKTTRKGSISYKKIVDDHLKDVDTTPYIGNPSVGWSLR